MLRRTVRIVSALLIAGCLLVAQGCTYHHGSGGYHSDFARYTPEQTSARSVHNRHVCRQWGCDR